jgi:uncharacterized protein (TIGR02594 family)
MLTDKYKWLETVGTLPKLVSAALQYLGLKEIPGITSNPVIIEMAKGLGVSDIYTNDDTSWCAIFINHLLRICGKPPIDYKGDRYNILRAKGLADWGNPVVRGEEQLGDIGIFNRPGGGHVAIIIASTEDTFVVIGGNQSNAVTFTEIAKNRLLTARRFYATDPPASAKKYTMDSSGLVSKNEA